MGLFDVVAILLTTAAAGAYANHKWIKLPVSIGLMLMAMLTGLVGIIFQHYGWVDVTLLSTFLQKVNFSDVVFHGMLSFLLFSGALHVHIEDLKSAWLPVAITATVSTIISTFLIGTAFYFVANKVGVVEVPLLYCLLLGAILSPTDPIAVLAIIKKMKAPKSIETKIAGESLFNDGVAIVLFITILGLIMTGEKLDISDTAIMLAQQILGGLAIGGVIGWGAYRIMLTSADPHVDVLITLAITSGGYVLAEKLHTSAPLAMVVAGIIIGNYGRANAMCKRSREYIDSLWELIDEVLNAVLFLLIGLVMMVLKINIAVVVLGPLCVLIALYARFISVAIPIVLMRPYYAFSKGTSLIMTWGGLRGAVSIALALSLPNGTLKELLLPCVYCVVIFSVVVQGLTFGRVLKHYSD